MLCIRLLVYYIGMCEVIHLGYALSFDLDDGPDILRVLKDLNHKANCVCVLFILPTVISNVFLLNYIVFFFMVVVFGLLTQNF